MYTWEKGVYIMLESFFSEIWFDRYVHVVPIGTMVAVKERIEIQNTQLHSFIVFSFPREWNLKLKGNSLREPTKLIGQIKDTYPPKAEVTLKKAIFLAKMAEHLNIILMPASEEPLNREQTDLIDPADRHILVCYTDLLEYSQHIHQSIRYYSSESRQSKDRRNEWKPFVWVRGAQRQCEIRQDQLEAIDAQKELFTQPRIKGE